MVIKLLVVWFLALVVFFVLWALLAKVTRRISEKRPHDDLTTEKEDKEKSAPEDFPSES